MAHDHPMTDAEEMTLAKLLADAPRNWGRWGPDDEVGSLNFLTDAEVLRGIRAVRKGKVFTCGQPIGNPAGDPLWPGRSQALRLNVMDKSYYQVGRGAKIKGGLEYADDHISMYLQGTTQYDALGHIWYDDQMWNGYPATLSVGGLRKASVFAIGERGVVGRGVLLDMAAYKGKPLLEKGETLDLDDLMGAARKQGVAIEPHDILCLRTGFLQLYYDLGPEAFYRDFVEPGLTYSAALVDWFHRMEIPALCTDTFGNETTLDPEVGVVLPLHAALMRNLGIALCEICNFEKLAPDCHQDGQWDFLHVAAPLKVMEGSGAPVNPIAVK